MTSFNDWHLEGNSSEIATLIIIENILVVGPLLGAWMVNWYFICYCLDLGYSNSKCFSDTKFSTWY